MPRNTTTGTDPSRAKQTALHGTRYANATSNRERACATYWWLLADIKRLPRDADREAAYGQLDRHLEALRRQLATGGRP